MMQSVHRNLYIEFYVEEELEISIRTRCPRGDRFVNELGECISLRSDQS
jgi:hypothetical protein